MVQKRRGPIARLHAKLRRARYCYSNSARLSETLRYYARTAKHTVEIVFCELNAAKKYRHASSPTVRTDI